VTILNDLITAGWTGRAQRVTLVTVTYGNRWHLLSQVLASAFAEQVADAIVVSNGSRDNVAQLCLETYGERVSVVDLGRNTGSAPGFGAGLAQARRSNTDFILILDDDNVLEPGGLRKLLDGHAAALAQRAGQPLIVLGFRPENQAEIAAGDTHRPLAANAFLGFHVKDIRRKLWSKIQRRFWARPQRAVPPVGLLDNAPYSGMLFRSSLLDEIGLPNPEFVLYADDTEFSYRVTRRGGQLLVITDARVTDVESSWNTRSRHRSAFDAWLSGGSDLGVYYAVRNRTCFERHYVKHAPWLRAVNRWIFFAVLKVMARQQGKQKRLALLQEAVSDGEARRLGVRQGFELR